MENIIKKNPLLLLSVKRKALVTDVIISVFILLFMHTATSKIFTFQGFDKVLSEVPMFGSFHKFVAVSIISLEIIIAALLIIPSTKKAGLHATLVLMVIFTIYLTYMVAVSSRLPCSCGGFVSHLSWQNHIWLNAALIGVALLGLFTYQNKKQKL